MSIKSRILLSSSLFSHLHTTFFTFALLVSIRKHPCAWVYYHCTNMSSFMIILFLCISLVVSFLRAFFSVAVEMNGHVFIIFYVLLYVHTVDQNPEGAPRRKWNKIHKIFACYRSMVCVYSLNNYLNGVHFFCALAFWGFVMNHPNKSYASKVTLNHEWLKRSRINCNFVVIY